MTTRIECYRTWIKEIEAPAYVAGLLLSLCTLAFAFVAALEIILRQPGDEAQDV
jgi:hypothetical protein